MQEETELPDIPPVQCARELLVETADMFDREVKTLRDLDYGSLALALHPGITTRFPEPDRVYYEITDVAARNLAIMAQGNAVAFEMVRKIIDCNIINGHTIHPDLRSICHALIVGDKIGPKRTGPKPGKDFALKFVTMEVIQYLCDAYGIPKTHGDGSAPASAAEIVRSALEYEGVYFSYNTVRDWTRREKHESFWLWRDALQMMLVHRTLVELGLSAHSIDYVINPWGQFLPTNLMPPLE